jgi:hypothetical protein
VDSNSLGTYAEYKFAAECIKRGYEVSFPLKDSSIYDCIIDDGNKVHKIQVKATAKKILYENRKTIQVPLQNNKQQYTPAKVDYFAIWSEFFNGFFIVKNTGNMQSLRLGIIGKYSENFNNFAFE